MSDPRRTLRLVAAPFPVDPADVPSEAVTFLQRQLVRHGPEVDDYEARVMIAGLIAVLAPRGGGDGELV